MSISNIPIYDPTVSKVVSDKGSGTSVQDLSQNFLRLLTVQLQNQDPMNPLDNAGMTTQLAALNQVDGINRLNTSMAAMVAQLQAAQFVQLADSVGKTAQVEGNEVYYSGKSVVLGAGISQAASQLIAKIRDQNGLTVKELSFENVPTGIFDFIWDGTDKDGATVSSGTYQLELQAKDNQGKLLMPAPYVSASVATIGREGKDIVATMSDGRRVSINDISKWLAF